MQRLELLVTGFLGAAAVVVATVAFMPRIVGTRELPPVPSVNDATTVSEEDWDRALSVAHPFGGESSAPVTVVALVDFQCPACRDLHESVKRVLSDPNRQVQVAYAHFPLSYHPFSLGAALAAECAVEEGLFSEWVNAVFAKQDSIGIKSWRGFAQDAGIGDPDRIETCGAGEVHANYIVRGLELGTRFSVSTLPTLLINGRLYAGVLSLEQLSEAIDAEITGLPRPAR